MYLAEELQQKWKPILEHADLAEIKDSHRRGVTAILLENTERALQENGGRQPQQSLLSEGSIPANAIQAAGGSSNIDTFDPVLISLVRRSMPNLIAYDICGVQPMTGPTGLIFAMRSTYGTNRDVNGGAVEAFYNEANTGFSGDKATQTAISMAANTALGNQNVFASTVTTGGAMATSVAEDLTFNEMGFSIEKVSVTAKSRALKAEYSMELAQDLKAVHGLDAETELKNC